MSDKHADEQQILDEANPFRLLNKKQFPQKKQSHFVPPPKASKRRITGNGTSRPDTESEDVQLFLHAMTGTERMERDALTLSQHELRGLTPDSQKKQLSSSHAGAQANILQLKLELPHAYNDANDSDDTDAADIADAELFNTVLGLPEKSTKNSKKRKKALIQAAIKPSAHESSPKGSSRADTPRGNASLLSHAHEGMSEAMKGREGQDKDQGKDQDKDQDKDQGKDQDDNSDNLSFADVMRGVAPLPGKGREILPEPSPKAVQQPTHDETLREFLEGKLEFALHHTNEYAEGHVVGLDLAIVGKLQAGQLSPEGHLDLHGMNAQQAYDRLIAFMRNAYLRNHRTVLLVTGRGLNSPSGISVLRERVQIWLTQEPLRRVVLAFCTAQAHDGGAGALYVMLRKFRKDQGKVQWDRTPTDPDLIA